MCCCCLVSTIWLFFICLRAKLLCLLSPAIMTSSTRPKPPTPSVAMMRRSDNLRLLNTSWILESGRMILCTDHNNHLFNLHFLPFREVDVSLLDVIKVSNQVCEWLSVNHQALDSLCIISHNVGSSHFLAGESLLSKKVSFMKMPYKLLIRPIFFPGHFDLETMK